ncbi:ABC transporter ATP-binding protein [Neobacillus rhizophilus]|uniref:ABC transporter ATP-binding protein n=1 Tax=Neobacillus rhizophilus TaxID=2833579 RepID=A0A942U7M8_9BACI|nr:ABC transporter ATP-binding protein [Neobacillus rhizophilus]MBS4214955.1 ABC transporter ATP-binding protein [Neobacillus rhizophilus]
MLELDNIYANYGSVKALKGVSLNVKQNSIVALLGANGAGKSSILKTITNLLRPHSGSITFLGERIDRLKPEKTVRKGIVMVPEGRQVFPELTVYENLLIGSYARKDRAQVKKDFKFVYELFPILHEKMKDPAGTLSGGQMQMLAIGRGLMSKPTLLLLDEPSLGLAPIMVQEIFRIIEEINSRGTTILLVEQNANMALSISDYAYVLETGIISNEGSAAELQNNDEVRQSYLGG